MSREIEQAAFRIFDEALDVPEAERAEFLRIRCGDDFPLRSLIERMLKEDSQALDGPDFAPGAWAERIAADVLGGDLRPAPERIGQYRPIREIGCGGMGVVYEAEQDEPRRRVALKVIRGGFVSAESRRRFRREAHLLGQLQHSGIAHVYEAGTARVGDSDWPFIAMELIDGTPIDKHAEVHKLSARQRLALMARVCDAVHHAHLKGVVHRDLKPANILIVNEAASSDSRGVFPPHEAIGQPKILDFGVARITDSDRQALTLQTEAGQVVGTLSYMSPEQVAGRPDHIDARSDIYSLGVLLFELLAGRLPHEVRDRSLLEAARIIRDDEPSRLTSVNASYRGDIETIVSKALAKEPDRRYQSAAEMAADIRRFLDHQPILARQASTLYQVRKFARRNKALVGGLGATFVALAGGLVAVSILLARVSAERNTAMLAEQRATRIASFQSEMLRNVDIGAVATGILDGIRAQLATAGLSPDAINDVARGVNGMDLARAAIEDAVLDAAVARLDAGYIQDPIAEAEIRVSVGGVFGVLFMFDQQLAQYERACALLTEHRGAAAADTLRAEFKRAQSLHALFRYDEARSLLDGILERASGYFDSLDPFILGVRISLADSLIALARFDEAHKILSDQSTLAGSSDAAGSMALLTIESRLAAIDLQTGKFEQAARAFVELAERYRANGGGRENPQTLTLLQSAAIAQGLGGNDAEAEALFRRIVDGWRTIAGDDHEGTIVNRTELALVIVRRGRAAEALPVLRMAHQSAVRALPPGRSHRVAATLELGNCLLLLGQTDECERVVREFIAARKEAGLPDNDDAGRVLAELLARCLGGRGQQQ